MSSILEIKTIPSELKEQIERLRLRKDYPKTVDYYENFSNFPDGTPCFFFWDEENELLLTSYVHGDKDSLLFRICFCYRDKILQGRFRYAIFNMFYPIFNFFYKKNKSEVNLKSAKTKTIMLKAVKFFPNVNKVYSFLENSTGK